MSGPFGFYLISAFFFVIYMVFSWVITGMLHLSGNAETMARMVLMAVGVGAFGYVFYFITDRQNRQKTVAQGGTQGAGAAVVGGPKVEIDVLFRQAQMKLAQSRLGKDVKLRNLPVFFVIGEGASAKTSVFVNSGTEPDLLAGQVYQAKDIVSTRPANLWLAQQAVFLEGGGALIAAPDWWVYLLKRLQPSRWRALFERKSHAARGAIVCVDSELFLRPGADDALAAAARNLNARLGEISHTLGIQFPVYVIFTKLDRLNCFTEFAANLADQEVNQVLGVTLPMRRPAQGVYAEEEARQLTGSFNDLFYALCDKRPSLLFREHDEPKRAKVYEFPREFRKLRNSAVRFLVDLGKPSQLRLNPFLRGFYFSGVRPLVKNEAVAARAADAEGTNIFDADVGFAGDASPSPMASVRTRRVPQWLFLGHLFSSVILQDRVALGASSSSASTEKLRRAGLIAGSALVLGWMLMTAISWSNNRQLETDALNAARGIRSSETGGGAQALPSIDSLERLDTLRESVALLSRYEREGHPWKLGWGLYIGHDIYPAVRKLYFARFDQILFAATQESLRTHLKTRPDKAAENEGYPVYTKTYDALKAFLITTQYPQYSKHQFLPPVLQEYWASGRGVDSKLAELAQRQFDFYTDELLVANPFPGRNDDSSVHHARVYLASFGANDRIYNFLIQTVSNKAPDVNFNRDVLKSAEVIANNRDMKGAFTVKGWSLMQDAIKNLGTNFGGEPWVLGDEASLKIDPVALGPELRARFQKDFIDNWRAYLDASSVRRYGSAADAAKKLDQLAGNESYLMQLFCIASENTNVADDAVKAPYQPVQTLEPPGCKGKFVNEANTPYLSALSRLQSALADFVSKHGTDATAAQQTKNEARTAHETVKTIARNFHADEGTPKVDIMTAKLLDDPITYAEAWIGNPELVTANQAAKSVCGEVSALAKKYPFKTSSPSEASMPETEHVFRPGDGILYTFWDQTLKNYVDKNGNSYTAKLGSTVQVSPDFLRFFNRAMDFSRALYRDGKSPHIVFTMRALATPGIDSDRLVFDGQVLQATSQGGEAKEFTWPGQGKAGAELYANYGRGDFLLINDDGLWATFRFFGRADKFDESGGLYHLQWIPRQGDPPQPSRRPDGSVLSFSFDLDLKGAPPIFKKGYLAGMDCPPGAAFR
jgi:type VI secretion system protein ImpL